MDILNDEFKTNEELTLNDLPISGDVSYDSGTNLVDPTKFLAEFIQESFSNSSLNGTLQLRKEILLDENQMAWRSALDYLLLVMLILIMLSMGCEIALSQLWGHIRRPVGLSIGIVSQFGIKPLAAFLLLVASGVEGLHATGVLIIACCPGGVLSNTFTYFSDGDLPLSVAMTTASTVMAMAMLPANIWLYGSHFESVDLVIPYKKMVLSLLVVTSPICVGMLIKWKFPLVAKWTTKIGTYTGLFLMFASCVIEVLIFPDMFTKVPARLYAIILSLPAVGLGLGYGIAALFRRSVPVCKTIAIECGIQNFPLALTVIALSFPIEMQAEIVLLPWLYGFAMICGSTFVCGLYQLHKKLTQGNKDKIKPSEGVREGMDNTEKEDLMANNHQRIELKSSFSQLINNGQLKV